MWEREAYDRMVTISLDFLCVSPTYARANAHDRVGPGMNESIDPMDIYLNHQIAPTSLFPSLLAGEERMEKIRLK